MKRYIKKALNYMGLDIVRFSKSPQNHTVLESNFMNLAKSYEKLFGELYGKISANTKRIEIMIELLGTPPSEAFFIVDSIEKTRRLAGDVCEFGVAQGITSKLIANEIVNVANKKMHLFDSFEGLPSPTEKDELKDDIFQLGSISAYEGKMKSPQESVLKRLAEIEFPLERTVLHKGFIEELIENKVAFPLEVSFAYIDFDFYEPIKLTLEYLHSVTKKSAIIMIDDYDYFSTGVKTAVSEFLEEYPIDYELFVPDKVFGCFAILTKIR